MLNHVYHSLQKIILLSFSPLLFLLSVLPRKPTLTASPSGGVVETSKDLELSCHTESQGPNITYNFYEGNNAISACSPITNKCVISSIQTSEENYCCQVEISGVESDNSSTQMIKFIGKMFCVYFQSRRLCRFK